MYTESYKDIKDRMLEDLIYDIDKREGSFINDMYSPSGLEFEGAYEKMDVLHSIMFVADAFEDDLTKKSAEFGVDRKLGEKAKGVLTFKGNNNVLIPRFMKVVTDGGFEYVTTSQNYIINGTVDIDIEAVNVGEMYNIEPNATWLIPSDLNVTEIVNTNAFIGGIDIETDIELKTRFFETVRNKRTSGNVNNYKYWAKEIAGVYNAEVYPLWNGNGTVKVVASGESRLPLDTEILYKCDAHIQDTKPIGADVTVATTNLLNVSVDTTIAIDKAFDEASVKAEVEVAIKEYIETCVDKIYYNKLGAKILSCSGVVDYSILTVNGVTTPIIVIGVEEVAKVSTIKITVGDGSVEPPVDNPPSILNIADKNAYVDDNISVVYNATDDVGIVKHELSQNGGTNFTEINPSKNGNAYTYNLTYSTVGERQCKIRVTDTKGQSSTSNNFTIYVTDGKVTGVSLDQKTLTLGQGQTKNLIATISPSNATNKGVTWSSDNRNAIDVGFFGDVFYVGAGGATITVTTHDGGFTDKCVVNGGNDGGGVEPPIPQPNGNEYRGVAFALKPWENGFTALNGIDMFKDYDCGNALICLPVDCSFSNNNPFCNVEESLINTMCDKAEVLGLKPILKMHTISLESDGQGNIDTPNNATTWFANYRTLVNKYADIVVKRGYKEFIITNELHNVMNKASWKNLFTPTIADVKAKGLKVSMSMNIPEVRENDGFQFFDELDFYCMNTYPQLTKNGVAWARDNFEKLKEGFYTPLSNMDIDYGELFKTMGGSSNLHKEIWITEVGCINKEKGLEYPAFWGNDASNPRNDEAQELWLKAVFDVMEKDKTSGKLSNRVTKYMLWDGNSDSDFNPVNKRGKIVLDTYWKETTTTPSDGNYFDIANTLIEEKGCTHVVDKANKTITVRSDRSAGYYGYLIWDTSKLRDGRRYRFTCKSSSDKSFVRFRVDNKQIIEDSLKNTYSIDFTGVNTKEKITDICLGIRQLDDIGTLSSIFSDIKIVDLDGDPPPLPNDPITYDVVDYKIIVKEGNITESYHSCDDIPRNLNGQGGVDGYKIVIKNRIKHYLSLTRGVSASKITIDGKKPFNYSLIDQNYKAEWSNRGYAVANNTLKYTIANKVNTTNNVSNTDKPISQKALDRGISIYNCAIPGYMQLTQDQNSINSVSEDTFPDTFLGICRLHDGERFHIHQNARLLGGYGNSSRLFVGILVHEMGHTTGIWDDSPHYPTTYTYLKDQQNEWLQPSDIAHIKDKFPSLTGRTKTMQEIEKTTNEGNVLFTFVNYSNEIDMKNASDKVVVGTFEGLESSCTEYDLVYNVYSFKTGNGICKIKVHETFDLGLVIGCKYRMYLNEFNYLLNPSQTILKSEVV